MRLAVDSAFFAAHGGAAAHIDVENYVDAVLDLALAVRQGLVEVLVTDDLMIRLAGENLLPLREAIVGLLQAEQIDWIAPHDLARALLELLDKANVVDADFIASLNAGEPGSQLNQPVGTYCSCHPFLDEQLVALCALATAHSELGISGVQGLLSPRQVPSNEITGWYRFSELLGVDAALIEVSGPIRLPVVNNRAQALLLIDFDHIAECEISAGLGLFNAIAAAGLQLQGAQISVPESAFGEQFMRDISDSAVLTNGGLLRRVVRAAFEVLSGTAPAKAHALRLNDAGSSGQLRQGNYRAMRHDVDHEYHIHYWVGPGGEIELASMRVHNYFDIPRMGGQ